MPDRDDDRDDSPRRDEDDYERRQRKSGPSGLLIGLIIGAAVLIVMCVIGGILVALFIPVYSNVREAAARSKEQNNMKQIALAFHNHESMHGRGFYAPFAQDEKLNLKKGLSHRVSLLPYLEQDQLYRQFDLEKGWNEGNNKALSDAVIPTFTTPFDAAPSSSTPFRSFVGNGALFDESGEPVRLTDITDGTSNTILVLTVREQVPWAQPKELKFEPGAQLPLFGHPSLPNGFNVAMADGSIRFVPATASQTSLKAAITRNGGEVNSEW